MIQSEEWSILKRMEFATAKIRGMGFILWQARHMAYHVMLGLLWVWFLRERWGELNSSWIFIGAIGSIIPDVDHLQYFLTYGKNDSYTKQIMGFIRRGQWRMLFQFIATGHKHNTNLSYHNIYIAILFVLGALVASFVDWQSGVVLFGAIVSHFVFDMADDAVQLGGLNPNWYRWGRPKK